MGWANADYDDVRAVEDRLVAARRVQDLGDLLAGLTLSYTFTTRSRAVALIERVERYLRDLPLAVHPPSATSDR